MNNYIIHDYMNNRRSLLNYLNSIGYKQGFYITNDIEDENLSSYEMINNAILITNNCSINLSGNTRSLPALLQRILTQLKIHTFYCSGNVYKGIFKTLRNTNCGFHKKDMFDYLSKNPSVIKDNTNYYLNINSGINMNTEVAFRYHDLIKDYNNNLFIKNINLNPNKISTLKLNHDHLDYNFFSQVLSSLFFQNPKKMPIMDKVKTELCKISYYKKFEPIIENVLPVEKNKDLPEPKNKDKAIEIWKNTVDILCSQESSYRYWLTGTTAYDYNYQEQLFMINCEGPFVKEMVQERLKGVIEKLLSNQLDKEMELEVL